METRSHRLLRFIADNSTNGEAYLPTSDVYASAPTILNQSTVYCVRCRETRYPGTAKREYNVAHWSYLGVYFPTKFWVCARRSACQPRVYESRKRRRGFGGDWDTEIHGSAGIFEAIDIYGD